MLDWLPQRTASRVLILLWLSFAILTWHFDDTGTNTVVWVIGLVSALLAWLTDAE